jgi:hypothetical protein
VSSAVKNKNHPIGMGYNPELRQRKPVLSKILLLGRSRL